MELVLLLYIYVCCTLYVYRLILPGKAMGKAIESLSRLPVMPSLTSCEPVHVVGVTAGYTYEEWGKGTRPGAKCETLHAILVS